MKPRALILASLIVVGNSSFAFSSSSSADCIDVNTGELIATIHTPVRAYGVLFDEDVPLLKRRCELLGGELQEVVTPEVELSLGAQ